MRVEMRRRLGAVILLLTATVSHTALSNPLVDAYKKEFAFLEAEKSALGRQMTSVEETSDKKLAAAKAEIESIAQHILGIRARADEIELSLEDVERQTASALERADLLSETIERAFETLKKYDAAPGDTAADGLDGQITQVKAMFAKAGDVMAHVGAIRTEMGTFFDSDGVRQTGQIVRIGRVAAFGVTDGAKGALAPAGAGKLKLWPEDAAASAMAMLSGKPLPTMAMFLFESLEKGIDEKTDKTALAVIRSGGIIAWVIVVLGGVGLLMMLLRAFILLRASSRTDRLLSRLRETMVNGAKTDALTICKGAKGAAARVLKSTIRNLDRDRDHLEDIVSEAILHEAPYIERFGATILVIAAVAPLLGLLGTVTGMISTFDIITEYGTGDPKLLSGGISEALVTTELGLIVAIPTLLIGTLLGGRANAILQTLERAALQIMNLADDPNVKARLLIDSAKGPGRGNPPSTASDSGTSEKRSSKEQGPTLTEEPAT